MRSSYASNSLNGHSEALQGNLKILPLLQRSECEMKCLVGVVTALNIDVASVLLRYNTTRTNFSKYIKNLKGKSGCGRGGSGHQNRLRIFSLAHEERASKNTDLVRFFEFTGDVAGTPGVCDAPGKKNQFSWRLSRRSSQVGQQYMRTRLKSNLRLCGKN